MSFDGTTTIDKLFRKDFISDLKEGAQVDVEKLEVMTFYEKSENKKLDSIRKKIILYGGLIQIILEIN